MCAIVYFRTTAFNAGFARRLSDCRFRTSFGDILDLIISASPIIKFIVFGNSMSSPVTPVQYAITIRSSLNGSSVYNITGYGIFHARLQRRHHEGYILVSVNSATQFQVYGCTVDASIRVTIELIQDRTVKL